MTDHDGMEDAALTTLIEYAEEVMQWHADSDSPDYNHCDESKCMWCEEVDKAIRTLKSRIAGRVNCKDCFYRGKAGYCESPKFVEEQGDASEKSSDLIYSYAEGGRFWVGPYFGCVHFKEKPENTEG